MVVCKVEFANRGLVKYLALSLLICAVLIPRKRKKMFNFALEIFYANYLR